MNVAKYSSFQLLTCPFAYSASTSSRVLHDLSVVMYLFNHGSMRD